MRASLGKASSICGWQPAHDELDLIVGELAPGFDLGHIGRLGEALKPFARFLARFAARQAKSLPPPGAVCRAGASAAAAPIGNACGKVDRFLAVNRHRGPLRREVSAFSGRWGAANCLTLG